MSLLLGYVMLGWLGRAPRLTSVGPGLLSLELGTRGRQLVLCVSCDQSRPLHASSVLPHSHVMHGQ